MFAYFPNSKCYKNAGKKYASNHYGNYALNVATDSCEVRLIGGSIRAFIFGNIRFIDRFIDFVMDVFIDV